MKNFDIRFKVVSENSISIPAKNKAEAILKAKELLKNSNFKDLDISNITKHYYVIELNNKTIYKKTRR